MKHTSHHRILTPLLALALFCACALPTSALLWFGNAKNPAVADFAENGLAGETILFSADTLPVLDAKKEDLVGITIDVLPDPGVGILSVGSEPVTIGTYLDRSAIDGLRFQSMPIPTSGSTTFIFTPTFAGNEAESLPTTVTIYVLTEENVAPIALNLTLSTYRNVALPSYFDAKDGEGDPLTFQITSKPARGSVTLAEDGSGLFVYTPYENKTGKDSFTYVAVDPAGNTSGEATVSIRIQKPDTTVSYSDMDGHAAHKAAIHLAEEGIFTGEYVSGQYFFQPDQVVTRSQFLTMAMSATGLQPLEDVSTTGFYDDTAIPTWAKGYISSALKAGAIRGSLSADGQPVFSPDAPITQGEATVIVNNLLNISDVSLETSAHWAEQAATNLATAGVIHSADTQTFSSQLTRGDVAELLDGALDVMAARENDGWFLFGH